MVLKIASVCEKKELRNNDLDVIADKVTNMIVNVQNANRNI